MTTPTETAVTMTDVVRFIQTIDQEAVSALFDTLNARARAIRAEASAVAAATIRIGDRVRLENISPKYLCGATAKVVGRKGAKFEIELDRSVGRFAAGFPATCAAGCLTVIDAAS